MMKQYLSSIALLILLVIPWLVGCGSKPQSMESPIEPKAGAGSADITEQVLPTSPLPTPSPEVMPGPDTGIVRGTLQQAGSALPLEERMVYLASIIHGDGQPEFEVAKMNPANDPRAALDADGSFVFTDVQPGKYALSTITPRGESILLLSLDTGKDIIIEVKAGEFTDLGEVPVNFGF